MSTSVVIALVFGFLAGIMVGPLIFEGVVQLLRIWWQAAQK